ncbi:MAG: hypothetical protein IPG01_16745 [Chitinophagaceae bacterium]|nr:hypothetical protein [Chitinophagaceae bacterium]
MKKSYTILFLLCALLFNKRKNVSCTLSVTDSNSVKNSLTSTGIPLTDGKFLAKSFNSIWCRDYGPMEDPL